MIRLATINDIDNILAIIKEIQKEMAQENNPQWNEEDDYPSKNKFLSDLKQNELYVYDDNILKGFMVISKEDNYHELVATTSESAYVLHRLAIKKEYRNEGLASKFFEYAEALAQKNNIKILKADTEEHNLKMNNLFLKLGFKKVGEFEYDDYPGHYIYYEKDVKQEEKK